MSLLALKEIRELERRHFRQNGTETQGEESGFCDAICRLGQIAEFPAARGMSRENRMWLNDRLKAMRC
ncbi:MAG TPA: hypothetical protein DCZ56_05645 [Sutterella sp.]|nr:hypothetical protein [Sutterella sp.]